MSLLILNRKKGAPEAVEESDNLDGVVDSTVFELDATDADSYSGTGTTWSNLISSPADGASQSDYGFTIGDVSFVGTADDPAAYFTDDGNPLIAIAGGNTDFLSDLHKTTGGSDFWVAIAFNKSDDTWQGNTYMMKTMDGGVAGNGFGLRQITNETVQIRQDDAPATSIVSTPAFSPADGDHIFIVSHSHSTNKTTYWIDSATGTEVDHTFSENTTDADEALEIYPSMTAEDRLYSFAMGNEYIGDTEAAAIISYLEAKHSRDYTP